MTVDSYGHLVPRANRAAVDRLPTVESPVEEAAKTGELVFGGSENRCGELNAHLR